MKIRRRLKSLRCLLSCICPCGALDVVRVVRANGRVDEIDRDGVRAGDFLSAHPRHILKKPTSSASNGGVLEWKMVALPPDAVLKRGKIYFLVEDLKPGKAERGSNDVVSEQRSAAGEWRPCLDSITESADD